MSLDFQRTVLTSGAWLQISTTDDTNVTVENFGVGAYQTVQIATGAEAPTDETLTGFRTLRPQQSQNFTNLDEGTVLWARSVSLDTPIEVIAGG